ncbi:MAG: GTPase HflX [Thermomicrobiales bacterium]
MTTDFDEQNHSLDRSRSTKAGPEQALLVAVELPNQIWSIQDELEELATLAETVNVEVVGAVTQKLDHPHPSTYVGKGKLQEIKELQETLGYDFLLVDGELTPAQLRNMEKALDIKIIDRTALILDVFAARAQTHEGRLQVELAQLQYRLPRLTRMWTHLSRQTGGGGVGLRGTGETQLEADRRESQKRITFIKEQLEQVHRHRENYRARRNDTPISVISLVGYTNAGKSTLLNTITGAGVLAEDKLFATLDPTTRRIPLPSGREVLLTDTVGFINNLPTQLVAAFRATLEEISEATVLVHVVDVTHPNAREQVVTVNETLEDLGVDGRPVAYALNKIDALGEDADVAALKERLGIPADAHAVPVSAQQGTNVKALLAEIEAVLEVENAFVPVTVTIPYNRSELVERFHALGRVEERAFDEDGTTLHGWLPERDFGRFGTMLVRREVDDAAAAPVAWTTAALPDDAAQRAHPAA